MINFRFQRFWAIFMARNKEFYRDPGALLWTFLFPILVILAFAYMFTLGDYKPYKIAHWTDEAPIPELSDIQWVKFSSKEESLERLRLHKVEAVIDTSEELPKLWHNEDTPQSKLVKSLVEGHLLKAKYPDALVIASNSLDTRNIRYVDWLLPGLLTMNVLWMALWGVGWVIVRHRKLGILKRLKASPVTSFEYLLGQLVSRLIVIFTTGAMVFVIANLIYPFRMEGSHALFALIYLLGCTSLSAVGLMIASRMSSEEAASGIINFLTYPMMFLSEIWFSIEGASPWVLAAAKCMPLWHMTVSMRAVMNDGATLQDVMPSILVLMLITVVGMVVGSLSFKWVRA